MKSGTTSASLMPPGKEASGGIEEEISGIRGVERVATESIAAAGRYRE
jgi:hypothetical protein